MEPKEHWQHVYETKQASELSWFQSEPHISLGFIRRTTPDRQACIADVGGGASTLVDCLLKEGYQKLTVLDISTTALAQAQKRLGALAESVSWVEGDALNRVLARASVDFWHDRAVFHFLTDPRDRVRYIDHVRHALRPEGHLLVATFAEDGPQRCSGLNVVRYSDAALEAQFAEDFKLLGKEREDHVTPAGVHQSFQYCLFEYVRRTRKTPAA